MMTYFHSERNANRLGASFKFLVSDKSKLYLLHKNRSYFLLLMKCNLYNSSNQELSSKEGVWCGTREHLIVFSIGNSCLLDWGLPLMVSCMTWRSLAAAARLVEGTNYGQIGATNWRVFSFPLRSFQKQHAGGGRWKWGITHDSWIEWMTQKWHKWCI